MMTARSPVRRVPFTDKDREAFAYVHPYIDKRPTSNVVARTDDGTIVRTHEQREIFSFNTPEVGDVRFDVRGIKDAVVRGDVRGWMLEADLEKGWVEHIRANGGVEVDHMARLTVEDLERPGVAVFWGNGYTTLIDGNNRLVRRWDDGERTFRFLRVDVASIARYMCRPGEEERFFAAAEAREGVTVLDRKVIVR